MARAAVRLKERAERKVREHIAIINKERFIAEQVGRVFDSTASLEEDGFVTKKNFAAAIVAPTAGLAEQLPVGLGPVVCVDDKFFDAGGNEVVERKSDERLVEDRHERLRARVGERPQTRSQPGSKNKCRSDRARGFFIRHRRAKGSAWDGVCCPQTHAAGKSPRSSHRDRSAR